MYQPDNDHRNLPKLSTDIVDKDRGFTIFGPEELYSKESRRGFLPNNGDLVKNEVISGFDIIRNVDYTNYTWVQIPFGGVSVGNSDRPLGGIHALKSDAFVVYVDSTQHPATLRFHNAYHFSGPDVDSVRIFRGSDYSDNGEILSGFIKGGQLDDTKIPVKTISVDGAETILKAPLTGVCLAEVKHGEACLCVAYDDVGNVTRIDHLHIFKTNLVMAAETPARQIMGIKLLSPFILGNDSTNLTLPVNIPISDIPLSCEITYTDKKRVVPIDGSRVTLDGLRNSGAHDTFYIASNAGQELPLVLQYKLARGESYIGDNINGDTIFKDYTATTENVDGAYSLKLFVVPIWISPSKGYRLNYYLYNLTRGNVYDATAYVQHVKSSANFDPLLFNVKQRLNVNVDVSKVNPTYRPHIHPQSFNITLVNPGTVKDASFIIEYVHDGEMYGENELALYEYSNVTFTTMDITCGYSTQKEWLNGLYHNSYPLYDRRTESEAPEPTHFEIIVGGKSYMHPISAWLNKHNIDFRVEESASVIIRFIRRTPTTTQQLGLAPMLAFAK